LPLGFSPLGFSPPGFSIDLLGLRLGFSASPGPAMDLVDRYVFPGLPRNVLARGETVFHVAEEECAFRIFRDGVDYASTPKPNPAPNLAPNPAPNPAPSLTMDQILHRTLVWLQQAVDEHVIKSAAGFTFLHAGVVGLDGAVALLVGSSGHGKSTLVADLIGSARRARPIVNGIGLSATYFSDEYAAIDEQGRLHPYPRALLIRAGRPEQHPVLPLDLGAHVADGPGEIRLILNLPYQDQAQLQMRPVGQSEGLRLLLEHTPHVLEDSPALFKNLTRIAGRARTFIGVRGDAPEAGDAILELLRGQSAPDPLGS
jgi:hypothetical protein